MVTGQETDFTILFLFYMYLLDRISLHFFYFYLHERILFHSLDMITAKRRKQMLDASGRVISDHTKVKSTALLEYNIKIDHAPSLFDAYAAPRDAAEK